VVCGRRRLKVYRGVRINYLLSHIYIILLLYIYRGKVLGLGYYYNVYLHVIIRIYNSWLHQVSFHLAKIIGNIFGGVA